ALVEMSAPFYMGLIQDRKMAELYLHGGRDDSKMDEVDRYRYRSLVSWWLVFHENAYYQWRKGLLDGRSYKPWANDLKLFIMQQNVAEQWKEMKLLFQDDFARHVTGLIEASEKARAKVGKGGTASGERAAIMMLLRKSEDEPHEPVGSAN